MVKSLSRNCASVSRDDAHSSTALTGSVPLIESQGKGGNVLRVEATLSTVTQAPAFHIHFE